MQGPPPPVVVPGAGAVVPGAAAVVGAAAVGVDRGADEEEHPATARPAASTTAADQAERGFTARFLPARERAGEFGGDRPLSSPGMTEIRGAAALVTGANGGLGRAIARALRDEGASVVVSGRRPEQVEALAADIGARPVVADLGRRDDLARLLEEAGPLDIAVMNAALPASGDLEEWDQAQIDNVLEVNLANPIAMTRALLPAFRARRSGHFVFVSSLSGKVGSPGTSLYSATKFGLRGFAAGLRCDLHGSGVGCSVINPGFVRDAGMFADTGAELPFGVGTVSPEQVAAAVVRAIRKDRAEVDVAPMVLKLGAMVGSLAPNLSATVQSRFGASVSDQMVVAQKGKRG